MQANSTVRTRIAIIAMLVAVFCAVGASITGMWAQQERKKELDHLRQQSQDLELQLQTLEKQVDRMKAAAAASSAKRP